MAAEEDKERKPAVQGAQPAVTANNNAWQQGSGFYNMPAGAEVITPQQWRQTAQPQPPKTAKDDTGEGEKMALRGGVTGYNASKDDKLLDKIIGNNSSAKHNGEMSEEDYIRPTIEGYDGVIGETLRQAELRKPESDADREKREKQERASKIIGATADGIRALGNLFFTTQYAPDMYDHEKTSQLKGTMAGIERLREAREKRDQIHNDLMMQVANLEAEKGKVIPTLRAQYAQYKKEKAAAKAAEEKAANDKKLFDATFDDKVGEQRGKADEAEAKGRQAGIKADNQNAKDQSEIRRNNAQAGAANRSNSHPWRAWDRNGKAHWFPSRESAVAFAEQEGYERNSVELYTDKEYNQTGNPKGSKSRFGAVPSRKQETETSTQSVRNGAKGNTMPGVK
ncbi:MAG: hypothetical protein K2H61_02820 [Muribaculaceae bacterium]|nr:hypothetical protein [Muribaculaceae bacterium]